MPPLEPLVTDTHRFAQHARGGVPKASISSAMAAAMRRPRKILMFIFTPPPGPLGPNVAVALGVATVPSSASLPRARSAGPRAAEISLAHNAGRAFKRFCISVLLASHRFPNLNAP